MLVTVVMGQSEEVTVHYEQENIAMSVSSWTTAGVVKAGVLRHHKRLPLTGSLTFLTF